MTARTCPQHAPGDPLCHYPNAAPRIVQQATPADDGMTWQAIRDVLLAAVAVFVILMFLFSVWFAQ